MSPQEITRPTTLALGFVTFGLFLAASVSLLWTTYNIAPHQVRKLKTRALKSLVADAVTAAAGALVSTSL